MNYLGTIVQNLIKQQTQGFIQKILQKCGKKGNMNGIAKFEWDAYICKMMSSSLTLEF